MKNLSQKIKLLVIIFSMSFITLNASEDPVTYPPSSKSDIIIEILNELQEYSPMEDYAIEINDVLYEKPLCFEDWMIDLEKFENHIDSLSKNNKTDEVDTLNEEPLELENWMMEPFIN